MTLQEILRAQGLTDEQIEKVVGEMKQNKIFTASSRWISSANRRKWKKKMSRDCGKYICVV